MTRDILLNNLCPTDTTFDCWNGDEICNCDDCNRVLEEWLYDYEKHIIEQYKADTKLKDTIRDIHDNVAQEMYCKGIDDFVNRMLEEGIIGLVQYAKINEIAKQLKAGGKNDTCSNG